MIKFTGHDQKSYEEEFNFQPLALKTELPPVINPDEDLILEVENSNTEKPVRIILNDTVFGSNGIHKLDTIKNGKIIISKEELNNLTPGPLQIEFYEEEERPLKETTKAGGRIFITYGLKREAELTEGIVKQ
jgi:hypothetical protein